MNKIFRVVWSQATQSWVVVSELTKAHKKQSSSNAQKSAINFSGNFIKSSAIALALLSGHSAYAALNDPGTGSGAAVAWGTGSQATTPDSVAIGKGAKAENANAIAIGGASKASGDSDIALGNQAKAENKNTVAIGRESKASGESGIALGYQATADKQFTVAIGAGASSKHNNAVAIGKGSQALGATSLALVMGSKATGNDSYAIGWSSDSIGEMSMAFGRESKARKKYDIVFGAEANTRDEGQGHSIAIGVGAMSGTHSAGKNFNGGDAGGVAIGTGAYTGVNKNNISINSSVAVGAGAGAGYRNVDADGLPIGVATDADKNNEVLVKAFGGTTGNLGYFKNAGNANKDGFFSFQNVNINEATALGRNARAIGDQSVAIGAQSVAGQGSIVIGGNDIQSYDKKKYFKAENPTSGAATTVNDYDAPTTPGTGKNGKPITITEKYRELVGEKLDNAYRSSYGQDGSTVIGMQAHSTTPLGVAIGTNSIVRKGAFGATAIGSGASVVANAEAAVAIGMGSEAQGNYAVAAGTAARAKESAVAAGYQANADKSAVAVGDSSNATTSSVAVGQLAKAEKVADIAVGQGAVASGEQGAIAMGLGTRAQGDSSIMIGGSEITKVAAQTVKYQKEKKDAKGHAVIKTTKKKEQINGEEVERTIRSVEMEAATGTIQDAYGELTNGATLNTATLDYSSAANKNGHGSISMGIHSLSTGDLGTAIGTGARVTKLGGVALGTGAISELQNGVAIGTGSRADANSIGTRQTDISYDKEGHIVPFDSKKVAYTFYWAGGTNTSEGDVVSFGTPGAERQLKNVAAGRIADDSTDAINGSQLNSVTKRMSSGWSVEGEKDHDSSGVLKLKGIEATGKSVNYADDGKSFTNGEAGTATGQVDKVRLNDEVKIRVGDNLVLNQEDASRPVYEDPDNKNRQTGTRITSKFTYSLNPVLKNLTSATFKNDAGDTTVINGTGVTVTPVITGKQVVSLTTSGLNNGGNAISNVAGNLPDTQNSTTANTDTDPSTATKSQEAPNTTNKAGKDYVNPNNAATVGDVLNAGWNLQGNGTEVDFVKPYDTVNFVNGDGTTATVASADGKTSTVKYSVNLGDGLEKTNDNKITVKASDKSLEVNKDGVKVNPGDKSLKTTDDGLIVNTADKSLEVTNDGLKVKTDGKTITTDNTNGLKVVTGEIEPVKTGADSGTVKVKDNDAGKIATVDSVVNAVNNAAWTATSGNAGTGTVTGTTAELIKAGNTVTFKAGDNLAIKQDGKNFIYSLKPALSGLTSAEFKDDNNNTVNITPTGITITKPADTTTNTPVKTVKLSQDGLDNGGNGISNVKSGLDTYGGNVPGTTAKNTGLVDLSKPTTGEPKVSDNTAATVGDLRNMGWIVSSDKTTGADGAVTAAEYSDKVKNANEVKFVGKNAAKVSGKTDPATGIRTITVDVEVPDVKTAELVSSKDGSVIAPSTNPELQKALKDAKDELAAAATPEQKEAAENKVKAAETELNKALDNKGVATAKNVAEAINNAGFNLKTSADGGEKLTTGTKNDGELIKPGNTVEMIAGKNLTVKQDESGKITYATKDDVEFNTVKVGTSDKATNGKKPVNLTTEAAKDASNNDDANKPTTALNISSGTGTDVKPTQLVGVGSVLNKTTINTTPTGTVPAGSTPTTADLVDLKGTDAAPVNKNAAATVGDLQNMGWVVSSDKATSTTGEYKDVVKNANEVRFVGEGTAVVSGKTDGNVRTITVKVDDQVSTNNAVTPVNYTKKDGTKVYPKEITNADGTKTVKFFENPNGTGTEVPDSEVITSVNGPKGTTTPTTLSNVASNLPSTKNNDATTGPSNATTAQAAPNTTNSTGDKYISPNNAATVGDVLNAGWNLQGNGAAVDFVKAYDTVNFINGDGTSVTVESKDGKTSTVKYSVNLGNGLKKDDTGNTISVKPADSSLVVDAAGVKVNTGTVNTVESGDKKGTVEVPTADAGKIATVDTVAKAVNSAAFTLKASATTDGTRNTGSGVNAAGELIKAGSTVEMIAGKNLDVKHDASGKITFATVENPSFNTVQVGGDQGPKLSKTDAGDLKVSGPNGKDPVKVTNVKSGLDKYGDQVNNADVPGTTDKNRGLVDLSKPANGDPKVSDNTAATVGDLRNMGWIVSADKKTDDLTKEYSDTVKNANEVRFVGEGTAIVSGKTEGNVRTITVKVDDQVSTNKSVTPVSYTKKDGTKVYPKMVKNPGTGKEELKFFENADGTGTEVPASEVITSVNGPEGTTSPTTLKNVKNNIPNINDGSKTITNPDGTEKAGDVENINKAPLTAEDAAKLSNPKTADGAANPNYIGNNAATVSDVLNAGWNLQNNGTAKDFVKPYDTVNFINGLGTTAMVTTREGNTTSDVTFNVKAANGSVTVDEDGVKVTTGEMKPAVDANNKETGAIATPADPKTAKQLKETLEAAQKDLATAKEALKTAETALAADPDNATLKQAVEDKKAGVAAKQAPVDATQKAHDDAGLNKVATVQNVAEAINNAGFNLKTSEADGGKKLAGSKDDGELIKPSNTVEMVAGKNLTVKQDANGKITYATKDDVKFTNVDTDTLNVGNPNAYTDGKGNAYTKVGDKYYNPADVVNGVPKQGATPATIPADVEMKPVSPVTMKAEAAKPATNNATDAQPSSALNVTSKDGKPTQIIGVGSTLNTKAVDTNPAGTAPGATPNTTPVNLVDLEGKADAPVNKNAAATVGDLQNMGWVVSAKDGNGYKDVVKNANVVDFKGGNGIEITGKTLTDGTREITVGIKEGEVTNKVTITHANGTKTDAVKIGDNYYKVDKDGKPVGFDKDENGKPAGTPLTIATDDKVTNNGAGFVTGNTVANAIQDSGWNVGIGSTDKDYSKDAKVYDKVNPNDDVKFANGANTNVSMVTVDALNEDGTKKATTFVKVDVNRDLKIDSVTTGGTATDKNGNNLVKVGDKYYKEGDVTIVTNPDGTTTVTLKENAKSVPPADVIAPKDGAMIVKNADGKDVVSATVGKDGNGAFGINGKDGKNGISMTAKDGQGTIGVNGKDGATTTIKGDVITIKDKDGNINTSTPASNELKDTKGNTNTSTADKIELKDKDGNTNTSTPTTNVLKDTNGNTNTSAPTGTTYTDKDENKTVVGPKEINISDKSGNNTASLTNKDLILNAKDPNTGVDKTSHVSGDKIAFTTTDEKEKVVDKEGKPVIDPATGKQKEVIKNPGNSTEYTNEGLKVIPNSTVKRDVNGNPTFLDKDGKPVMKDTDGKYKYVGQDGKPGDKYDGSVGALKPNVVDNTRVISFGMDKPVLDSSGNPVKGPDGKTVMTEGISAGMERVHNVAPGRISPTSTDAVNGSQLYAVASNIGNLNNKINKVGKHADAGTASALAAANIPQAYTPGKSLVGIAAGSYQGQTGVAVGMSRISDNGKIIIRLSGTTNTQGRSGVAAGVGYQW